ncbi:MAG: acid phosphatase [Verrucomicrobiota bacterium]
MEKRLSTLLCTVVLVSWSCLFSSAGQAVQPSLSLSPSPRQGGPPKQPHYLTGEEDVWSTFPPKPALGSPIDQADLSITLFLQNSRTEDQKKEALGDQNYSIKLVTDAIAADFETKYPNTFQVLLNADIDAYFITAKLKKVNGRLRPFVQHPILVTPLFTANDFSYPSGHSSGTELQARILGKLFPARSEALLTRARQVADGRVVAGVHYASDTEAGIALGDLLFSQLETKPEFENDLTAAGSKDQISR